MKEQWNPEDDGCYAVAEHPPELVIAHPVTGEPVKVVRGESGYYGLPGAFGTVDDLNLILIGRKATVEEMSAYTVGSMFGWNVPGAMI